jgi:BirA family biotin operon repressor/biotin-[acetyl-CoA-carboxylase] ligase
LPHPGKENPHRTTFDNQLIELESVDSTNNYAMARIHEGLASDGMVCLAHHQWAGKGQRGRVWLDEPGHNLIMSLVIEPAPLKLSSQFLFSATIALGIIDLIIADSPKNWYVKWPNDIYWNDRKAAGILIENVIQGQNWLFAVVGIGMNLNQSSFPAEIPDAVSLKLITGKNYDPVSFARELVPSVQSRIGILKAEPQIILRDYNTHLYRKNAPITLKKGENSFETRINAVDSMGLLVTDHGSFTSGEIAFPRP